MVDTIDVLKIVSKFNNETPPGRMGSLKLPRELLADASKSPLAECREAFERAHRDGLIVPGREERERWQFSPKGEAMLRRAREIAAQPLHLFRIEATDSEGEDRSVILWANDPSELPDLFEAHTGTPPASLHRWEAFRLDDSLPRKGLAEWGLLGYEEIFDEL